jgi:hypothetical protein
LRIERLRRGELIAGGSGAALLVFLFALNWYGVSGTFAPTLALGLHARTSWTGWQGLTYVRWLLLVTALVALALAYFQAVERAPAIPVTLAVIATVLGGLSALALIARVIDTPGNHLDRRVGVYLGLAAAIGIGFGGFRSLREEDGADPAGLEIETVTLPTPT